MTKIEIDWADAPADIAYQIYSDKLWYAVKLMHAYKKTDEDFCSDWYLYLAEAVAYIQANPKYKKTVSTACIFAYRKLANHYRDMYTRAKRADPDQLFMMGQAGSKAAAITHNTYMLGVAEGYSESEEEFDCRY